MIETTDEHSFHPLHTGGRTRADHLKIGDLLSAMHGTAELIAVEYGTERVPVHNLSIPGSPTYFVGELGVRAHNCGFYELFMIKYEHFMHRKGWDTVLGTSQPHKKDVAAALDILASANLGSLKDNGIIEIVGVVNGHEVYVHVFARANRIYNITTAGTRSANGMP